MAATVTTIATADTPITTTITTVSRALVWVVCGARGQDVGEGMVVVGSPGVVVAVGTVVVMGTGVVVVVVVVGGSSRGGFRQGTKSGFEVKGVVFILQEARFSFLLLHSDVP